MSIPSTRPSLRHAAVALMLAALSPTVALAQTGTGGTVAGASHTHKTRKGNANQPAPTEHQPVQPSSRLPEEPNQLKEQVAPTPSAPVKPGTGVKPGQDTPSPQRSSTR